jgi:hypothetical protein
MPPPKAFPGWETRSLLLGEGAPLGPKTIIRPNGLTYESIDPSGLARSIIDIVEGDGPPLERERHDPRKCNRRGAYNAHPPKIKYSLLMYWVTRSG